MAGRSRHGRRAAREAALRLLYEADVAGVNAAELFGRRRHEMQVDAETGQFVEHLIGCVVAQLPDLDRTIASIAPAWPVDQMARLDVAILRMAISEIDEGSAPTAVIINEAVELAKLYCSESARRFINGALGTYVRRQADVVPPTG